MKTVYRFLSAMFAAVYAVSLQAHEGHAAVGSLAHDIQHGSWLAAALMLVSVLILSVFSVSARYADKYLFNKTQANKTRANKILPHKHQPFKSLSDKSRS